MRRPPPIFPVRVNTVAATLAELQSRGDKYLNIVAPGAALKFIATRLTNGPLPADREATNFMLTADNDAASCFIAAIRAMDKLADEHNLWHAGIMALAGGVAAKNYTIDYVRNDCMERFTPPDCDLKKPTTAQGLVALRLKAKLSEAPTAQLVAMRI